MEVAVFSDSAAIKKCFDGIKKSRVYKLLFFPSGELKKKVKTIEKGAIIYVDIDRYGIPERDKVLKYLSKLDGYRYGIVDGRGIIGDIPSLFFNGASDYIGKEMLKEGMTFPRLKKAVSFRTLESDAGAVEAPVSKIQDYIISGSDWQGIKPGKEYTFCFMYIELENQTALKDNLSDSQISSVMNSFKKFIERSVAPLEGRLWIWNDFGGLILFPFDGERCNAILACFRLVLSRRIYCVEELGFDISFNYRIALYIGNTVYKMKGDTGTIVSDSVNSIFHLGKKYVKPGNFYLTEEVFRFSPQGLKKCFLPTGSFEGQKIMRMRLPM